MSPPLILALMSFCFLFFGYLGVPVPFSLMALFTIEQIVNGIRNGFDHPEDRSVEIFGQHDSAAEQNARPGARP